MGVDKPNYTQIPNLILDDIMRYMDGAELKVTLAIARQTFGFHREKIKLTISDIEELTSLSRPSVTTALDVGIRRNMIRRDTESDGKFSYSLVINDEVLATSKKNLPVKRFYREGSKDILPPTVKEFYRDGKETLPKSVKRVDRLTPVLKKEKESIKEKKEDDDLPLPLSFSESARAAVHQAWRDQYGEAMPANLIANMDGLTVECGPAAVIHGIVASLASNSRNFKYIASCARNYVPEPPRASYAVDLPARPSFAVELPDAPGVPGVYALPTVAQPPAAPTPLPAAMAHADPWAVCLAELSQTLPNMAANYLKGSRLEPAGEVDDAGGRRVPLYRVVVSEQAAAGMDWLKHQGGATIRRKLGSVLGRPVLIEVVASVAAEMEVMA